MNPEMAKKVPEYMIQQGEDFLGKILARQGVWNAVLLGGPVPTAEDQDMQDIGVIAFFSIFNFSLQHCSGCPAAWDISSGWLSSAASKPLPTARLFESFIMQDAASVKVMLKNIDEYMRSLNKCINMSVKTPKPVPKVGAGVSGDAVLGS